MASLLSGGSSVKASANNDKAIANATERLQSARPNQSLLSKSYGQTGKQSISDQALSALSPLMNLAGTGLNIVERPSQAILHSLQAFSGQGSHLLDPNTLANAGKGFVHGLTDFGGKDNLNLRGTMNLDPNFGGRGVGLIDTIGTSAIDPLTYVTGGTSAVGKVGLKIVGEKLGKEVADAVAKQGIKTVGAPTRDAIEAAFRESPQAAAAKGGADKFTKNAMNALDGGAGIKFAGKTALKYDTLAPAANAVHLPQALDALKSSKVGSVAQQAFSVPAKMAGAVGPNAAKAAFDVIRRGRAAGDNGAMDAVTQTRALVKESKIPLAELRDGTTPRAQALNQKMLGIFHEGVKARDEAVVRGTSKDISTQEMLKTVLGDAPDIKHLVPAKTVKVGEEVQGRLAVGEKAAQKERNFTVKGKAPLVEKHVPGQEIKGGVPKSLFGYEAPQLVRDAFKTPDRKFTVEGEAPDVHITSPAATHNVGEEAQGRLGTGQAVHIPARTFTTKGEQPELTQHIPAFQGTADGQTGIFGTHTLEQIGRTITKETAKAIHANPTKIARALNLDASATPANIIKHIQTALPNETLQGANVRLSQLIGVKNAIETNPAKNLVDQTVKAHRDAATADTLHGLMNVMDDNTGKPLISTVARPGDVARETILGTVHGPKEVLDALDHAAITLTDDHALKQFGSLLDGWGKLWRGYATVPTLFGVGFHERNLVGNVFNMWLLGFHNPALFRTSDKILRAIESGTNNAHVLNKGGQGLTADAAIAAAKNLSPEDRTLVREAYKEGVIGDSFFRTDQATTPGFKDGIHSAGDLASKTVGMQGPIIKSGSYIGRRIEDNSRLAMFIDQMQKHGDPQIAAENVKKALFDYSELTPTEKAIKKFVPFYTYTRKNTPLQVQAMLQNPGKFSAMAHLQDNMNAGAPDLNGEPVPQYALANGAIPLLGGKTPILGSLSTPYQAAAQQIQPLAALASQLPGVPQNLKTEGGTGDPLRQILSNFGGGPLDLAKLGVEQATGTSLFTGQAIKPGTGLQRTAKALIPLVGKGDSTISDLGSSDSGVRNAKLISALTGLQTTALTTNKVEGEKARRAKVLQALAKGTPKLAHKSSGKKSSGVPKAKKSGGSLPKGSLPKAKKAS